MNRLQTTLHRIQHAALHAPGLGVLLRAIRNYILHQSANQAGSLAFSSVLAMFPLLILLSASAGYIGKPGDAAALIERVVGYAPQMVRDVMQPVIDQVLAQRNQALLAIGVVVTLWTASSGMQAIRSALNRAYGIERGLAFWKARIKVTLFTVVVGSGVLLAFSSVVVMPYVWLLLAENLGAGQETLWLRNSVRYGSAFIVLVVLYALMYGWLPDIRQRLYTVLPGAFVGAALCALDRGCRQPVLHLAHGWQAGSPLRQLRGCGRYAGVPVHQRDHAYFRSGDQRRAAGGSARKDHLAADPLHRSDLPEKSTSWNHACWLVTQAADAAGRALVHCAALNRSHRMTSIHSANMAASTTPIASTTSSTSTSSSSVQVNLEAEVTQLMQDQAEARNMGVASQLARQKRLELLKLEAELRNGSISADEFHVRFAEIKNGA